LFKVRLIGPAGRIRALVLDDQLRGNQYRSGVFDF
jgi:hypothetical protein